MKAICKSKPERGLWMVNVDKPSINANEVLIKVKKSAICGTDVHIYKWDEWSQREMTTPTVIGHEFMGEVAEVGSNVKGVAIGQRVTAEGHITCGTCRSCRTGKAHLCAKTRGVGIHRDGAMAEYVAVPQENVFILPEDISDNLATIFDPLGNAVHTALENDLIGEDVLITGAGPIGCMAAAIARHGGARHVVITDINDYRLSLAKTLGATHTVNVSIHKTLEHTIASLGIEEGFDVGLEMSGSPLALQQMLEAMIPGGQIALLGILPRDAGINWDNVIFKGLTVKGIYGRKMFDTWYKMCHMIQGGLTIEPIITHQLNIGEFQQGFDAMLHGEAGKVILNWE
jgi:threonine 3-dehydrogenase